MPINDRYIIVYDFETCGKDPHTTEITQVAAQVIDPRTLELGPTFNSECKVLNEDLVEQKALEVTGKTIEQIRKAPGPEVVWAAFTDYCHMYNKSSTNTSFKAAISSGWNIDGFDSIITERYCQKYGPLDKKKNQQSLFSSFMSIDLMKYFWIWYENTDDIPDYKFDTQREHMGLSTEAAHDALFDVKQCAQLLVKVLNLHRNLYPKIQFKDCFKNASA